MKKLIPLILSLLSVVVVVIHAAAVLTFLQTTSDTTDQTTYNFIAVPIGPAAADRCVVVTIAARRASATETTITSVTIAGNAAIIQGQNSFVESGADSVVGVASLIVTTGTTADISVTYSGTMVRNLISVSNLTGAGCTTIADVEISEIDDPSVALDIPAGGAAFGICLGSISAATATWIGLTERHDAIIESLTIVTGGSLAFSTIQTGLTVGCTLSTSTSGETGIFVSFSEASAAGVVVSPIIGGGIF